MTARGLSYRDQYIPHMGEEMAATGEEAGDPDWAKLRQDYEEGTRPVAEIAAEAGMSRQKLVRHATLQGWKPRGQAKARTRKPGTRQTIQRLKSLLQQRLSDLEGQMAELGETATAASSEREIRSVNTLVRTLEKVLELERKQRKHRAARATDARSLDDAEREALADKLEALCREQPVARDSASPEPAGTARGEP